MVWSGQAYGPSLSEHPTYTMRDNFVNVQAPTTRPRLRITVFAFATSHRESRSSSAGIDSRTIFLFPTRVRS